MNKRRLLLLAGLVVFLVAVVLLEPTGILRGYLRQERFFGNRPSSTWGQRLRDPDPVVQKETMTVLKAGGTLAVPVLVELLRGKEGSAWQGAEVRWMAADMLGAMGHNAQEALPALWQALGDQDPHVRKVVADALLKLDTLPPLEVRDRLIELLKSEDRIASADLLCRLGPEAKEALQPLLAMAKDPDPTARWHAVATIGRIGPEAKTAVPDLRDALKDEDPQVREHAAESLGQIGSQARAALPALLVAVKDPVWKVRKDAARSLGQIGDREAIPALKLLLQDEHETVRKYAQESLRQLE